jgi:hypothetical protein
MEDGCESAADLSESHPCRDFLDNDGDGYADWPGDPGCSSLDDLSERSASLVCDNGLDDDGDTLIDSPADPNCLGPEHASEHPQCSDGLPNDPDGLVDYPADPGCAAAADASEQDPTHPCDDGADNDADGRSDYWAPPGQSNGDPGCQSPTGLREDPKCQNGINDDGDGLVDFDGGQSIHGACAGSTCPPGVSDPDGNGVANPDPHCANPWRNKETACGLGAELALAMPLLGWLRRRSRTERRTTC